MLLSVRNPLHNFLFYSILCSNVPLKFNMLTVMENGIYGRQILYVKPTFCMTLAFKEVPSI